MRMDTRLASTAAAQGTEDIFIEQLVADAELAEHSQQLGGQVMLLLTQHETGHNNCSFSMRLDIRPASVHST